MKYSMILVVGIFLAPSIYAEENPAIEAMQEYLEFAEYSEGSISTEQLASIEPGEVFFVDTRNKGQFEEATYPAQ